MIKDILVFSLSSNIDLTNRVCELLGIQRSGAEINHFADGECLCRSKVDVRGKKIYIIQSTCSPVNSRIMETLIFIDSLKRANCKEITLIAPYFGYARQDRIAHYNEPITAKMVADLFSNSGISRIIIMEMHTLQLQGFFSCPCDNLTPAAIYADYLKAQFEEKGIQGSDVAIVAPDHGAIYRARELLGYFPDSGLVVIDKRRPKPNVAEITNVVGDFEGKICVMIDDIIDTGGTLCAGAKILKEKGAKGVILCAAHPLFSHNAQERFENNDSVDEVIVTDIIEHPEFKNSKKIHVLSVASMLADVIRSQESHEAIKDKYARFH